MKSEYKDPALFYVDFRKRVARVKRAAGKNYERGDAETFAKANGLALGMFCFENFGRISYALRVVAVRAV